jgi:hypothetical protein
MEEKLLSTKGYNIRCTIKAADKFKSEYEKELGQRTSLLDKFDFIELQSLTSKYLDEIEESCGIKLRGCSSSEKKFNQLSGFVELIRRDNSAFVNFNDYWKFCENQNFNAIKINKRTIISSY